MENEPYLLAELEDLSPIFSPLKTTSRIKYTCFNVSNYYLIFGATSGGLYVFRREPCCFLQLLPNKEGAVTQVSISPNEKLIAFSTIKGTTCVLEKTPHGSKPLVTTSEHQNEQITCLQWNTNNNELFVGDGSGKVFILMVSIFPATGMFQTPSLVLMHLDSKIVQMDFRSNMLLVSTLTKCYICDTKKEIFRQVGQKLRDGEYGACIYDARAPEDVLAEPDKSSDSTDWSNLKLLCARPGSRIWECSIDGTVISTQHFKEALAVPPRKIYFLKESSSQNGDINNSAVKNGSCSFDELVNSIYPEQSFNFSKLQLVSSRFFFTFKTDGIYVFDPQKAIVLLWNNQITNIVDAKSSNDVIYVWSGFGKVYALNLVSLEKYLIRLYFQKKYSDLAKLCTQYKDFLMSEPNNHSKLYILQDLDEKLKSDFAEELKPLIDIYKEIAQRRKPKNAQKLKSNIYLVGKNVQFLMEDKRLLGQQTVLEYAGCLNFKGRSHSVSPERFQKGKRSVTRGGSSSSLPDMANEGGQTGESEEEKEGREESGDIQDRGGEESVLGGISSSGNSRLENVLNACEAIRGKSDEGQQSKILVFNLFDNILELERFENPKTIRPLPLRKHFTGLKLNLMADCFQSALNSGTIFEWIPSKLQAFESDSETHPGILAATYSSDCLRLDYKLSVLLRLLTDILKESEIMEALRGIDCYYKSFHEILEIYRESSLSSVSESTLDLGNASSSPKLLNIVNFLFKVGQVEKCAEHAGKIDLNDLFYIVLGFEESSKKAGKSPEMIEMQCQTLFLTYLDKALKKNCLLENSSDIVDGYVINCLENINSIASSTKNASCRCGFPRGIPQSSVAMFPEIGYELVRKKWPLHPDKCLEICSRISHLWNYLIYFRRAEPLESVLPLILQCGSLEELENRCEEIDDNMLELCASSLIKLKMGICLNCEGKFIESSGETVSWADFGMLAIKVAGPDKTLDLFTSHAKDISSAQLSQSFFQGLIFSMIAEQHNLGSRKKLVDILMGKKSRGEHSAADPLKRKLFGKEEERFETSEGGHEDDWKVNVNVKDNCKICSLPLDTKALAGEAGLVVFKCTHAFHSACLQKINLECPTCKKGEPEDKDE